MNKTIIHIVVSFLFSYTAYSQSRIIADVSNLKNDKGVCRACIFNNASSFNTVTGEAVRCEAVKVKDQKALVRFENVPPGSYAIFVFHDENSNNKMDKNFFGIPKEGYGASKNKLPFAAAPTFNDNMFSVNIKSTLKLYIKVRNL